MCRIRR